MENHTQYGNSIYFHHGDQLFVNLFIPSVLNWQDEGITLRQETIYPESDTMNFKIKARKPVMLTLNMRYPSWARPGMSITVNGKPLPSGARPGTYAAVQRVWKNGDELRVQIPFGLRAEVMPGDAGKISILYGPLVLGGELGEITNVKLQHAGSNQFGSGDNLSTNAPSLINNGRPVAEWVKPVAGKTLTFQTVGVGQPRDVTLVPFYKQAHERYIVYWDQSPIAR
jgi:hypothetical protein